MATKKKTMPTVPELIAQKRNGGELSDRELQFLVNGYVDGSVTDYQMAAFAMATYFQGMKPRETAALTLAMRDSGHVIDLKTVKGLKVDKHSTGGVGDKVSICLAPLVAACGVPVPMISGRGLGHTGGTLDKLEAIPGFDVNLSVRRFVSQLKKVGCSLGGQTAELAPADKKLYALRDVTATVESIPLITGSILAKKLAEGIDALVMDVKVGEGAFMKTQEDAQQLARSIVRVGKLAGKKVSCLLTRMDSPLGREVGNANETREAFALLSGGGPDDLVEVTMALGAEMLRLGGIASGAAAHKRLRAAIADGSAIRKAEAIVKAQGGDPRVVTELDRLEMAKKRTRVKAPRAGYVRGINALEIGLAGVALGAGRTRSDQDVDHAVGITIERKPGERVNKGDTIATIHHHGQGARVRSRVQNAFSIVRSRPADEPLLLETIRR
ncbi:MAG: thymidine phosphorylase [Myxococcota bacterium]